MERTKGEKLPEFTRVVEMARPTVRRRPEGARQTNDKSALAGAVGAAEPSKVEKQIGALRTHALVILVVSHDLERRSRSADRVFVPRRGARFGARTVAETDEHDIVAMSTGAG